MDLRDYEHAKFELAALLRAAGATSSQLPQATQERVRNVFARLAEDRFNLVVVGRFSRGKTSLMNAVLGTDRLPTGIRPITSVITTVAYGSKEKALIHFTGLGVPQEVALGALPQFITEAGNSGNRRRVQIAEVQLPAELLRRGFHFIDTPGLGSPILENTRTTERFLPEADAFVLVTSFEGPLSEEEVRFLRGAAAAARPVFIVVNKQDIASPAERNDTMRYLRDQLREFLEGRGRGIFPLSAREGLAAKQTGNAGLLEASGVAAFENELVRFLIDEKSRVFLRGMCERIAELLPALPRAEASRAAARVAAFAEENRAATAFGGIARTSSLPTQGRAGETCEICHAVIDRCFDFLREFQYAITINPDRQQELAGRGGLCAFHTWVYARLASPQGTCSGYPAVLDRWAARLRDAAERHATPEASATNLIVGSRPEDCLACEVRAAAESAAVASLAGQLGQRPDMRLASLSDLCLPHLRLLAAALGESAVAAKLFAREAAILQGLAENMRRYALKHDGTRRYLASEEEETAAARALMLLAGHRTLNTSLPDRSP